jgi:putative hemolysin
VKVRIGSVIPQKRLAQFQSSEELVAYLRVRTYILRGRRATQETNHAKPSPRVGEPIALAQDPSIVATEIASLPATQQLAAMGSLACFWASATQIPTTLREIGRLRELTFRAVGEGTGTALDLDRFDNHYLHLFVWNAKTREIVGSYRLGLTDEIRARAGAAGLYTSTLFHFRRELLDQIGPAIELGRSFVRPEYQKEYAPLSLLWKGIGTFVARHPQYKMLFGPVSISNEYQSLTRQLLMSFLRMNRYLPSLAKLIRPRNAPRIAPVVDWDPKVMGTIVRDIDEVDGLVSEIESERLSVPVLLRQYLKLNAKLLGFNVDPSFGDVLDALMLVDLTQVPRAILTRYMGSDGASGFLKHHER